jgi:mono/diheme cytochrome c family protein
MRSIRHSKELFLLVIGLAATPAAVVAQAAEGGAAGKTVYLRDCAKCHGASGKGDGPIAASLSPKPTDFTNQKLMSKRSDQFLMKVIENGGAAGGLSAAMPAFKGTLSSSDIKNVTAYIRELGKPAGEKGK